MQPRPVKAPTPEIRNHMTSCLNPNGTVAASVDGNTSRYVFNWYKGDRVQGTPFFTGSEVSNLDRGVFSVTATDKETACVSEKATFTILDGRKYPDFTLRVINSSCSDNTGVIELIVNKAFNLDQISWSRGATSPNATNVSQQPTGEYAVTLTTKEGCSTTKKAIIGVAVQAYNGVSANNDGLNDHFIIDCIETFPGNNVKILNRAGALVFEGDSYDNVQVKFEGTGNRGMYVTGNQLPAGTYFYIIDKKDGSKTLSGYLELVR
jgi:gliding motility-associated-like protein